MKLTEIEKSIDKFIHKIDWVIRDKFRKKIGLKTRKNSKSVFRKVWKRKRRNIVLLRNRRRSQYSFWSKLLWVENTIDWNCELLKWQRLKLHRKKCPETFRKILPSCSFSCFYQSDEMAKRYLLGCWVGYWPGWYRMSVDVEIDPRKEYSESGWNVSLNNEVYQVSLQEENHLQVWELSWNSKIP